MGKATGLSLSTKSEQPLYQQLFEQISGRIRTGTWPPGYRLPPTRELATELSAHRNTVVRVYEELEDAGFVSSTVGRGTFVAELPPPATPDQPPARGSLPWASLTSNAVAVEPLGRQNRINRSGTAGAKTIALSRMQPSADLLPHELLRRCMDHVLRNVGAKALGYTPREGLPRLRELIAEDLVRQGVPASADELLITTGSQQGLDLISRTLINPGDPFLTDESTYHGALNLLSAAGARLIAVPSDAEGPSLEALTRDGRAGVKGFYLMPNCQNPTGLRVSVARREALVAWSHRAGMPLIEDDYASDLNLDGKPPLPALRSLDGEVVYLGTYSKKLIPALRIGYLLCPPALQEHVTALKHSMDLGTSGILQHALAEFLGRGYLQAHLTRVLAEYRVRRDALEEALRKHLPADVTWRHPETGLQLWIPTPGIDPEQLYVEALQHGVMISPGTLNAVGASPQRGLRLTYCAEPKARLVEGAKLLGKAWAAVERRSRSQKPTRKEGRVDAV
jgi:DNA-binding transcriptional MocR family regulator